MARKKKNLTEEEKLAKKKHVKEEIASWICMLLFCLLFVVIYAMFSMQSTMF